MKAVTAKGLGDLRTATTTRVRSRPCQKGTAHLDIYMLSKEKQRLETELTCLEKRQRGIHERLAKIVQEMDTLELELERRRSSDDPSADIIAEGKRPATPSQCKQPWKKMTVEY